MPSENDIRTFKRIKSKIQREIATYLESRQGVLENITARQYGVTIFAFSTLDEKKYLQAKKLLNVLQSGVSVDSYQDLYNLLKTAETNNAKLVRKTVYSKGALGKALTACLALIPEEKKHDNQPLSENSLLACSVFSEKSTSISTNDSIGTNLENSENRTPSPFTPAK